MNPTSICIWIYSMVSSSICLANSTCRYMTYMNVRVGTQSDAMPSHFCVNIPKRFIFRYILCIISILVGL